MSMFDATRIPLLSRALDAYALRQRAMADNLANVDTPGYRPKHVAFEEHLAAAAHGAAMQGALTDPRHLPLPGAAPDGAAPVVEDAPAIPGAEAPGGVNGIDIDREMTDLAVNQIRFRFAARLLGDTFRGIQKSIRGQV
jgi:flagellar basal-body rod protein FlgB